MIKSILRSPITTVVLFALAAGLLLVGSIGAVQAAPRIQSNVWKSEVVLTDIETAITENTKAPGTKGIIREGDDDLLTTFLEDNDEDQIKIGKSYDYELAVRNIAEVDGQKTENNGIPQYVRVTVNKYWVFVDENGNPIKETKGKEPRLNPAYIELGFVEGNGWTIDKKASTPERTVLYYAGILDPGDDSAIFTDKLRINPKVLTQVTEKSGETTFDYAGVQFRIKATVDAVQTHNASDAMTSAWGRTN